MITVDLISHEMLTNKILPVECDLLSLFLVFLRPLYLLDDVADVSLEGNVVFVGLELPVEVLVVVGVLLEHHRVARQEVGEAVRRHRAIHVDLVLVLQAEKETLKMKCHRKALGI